MKARKAVDYVPVFLLYDNFEMLRRVISTTDLEVTAHLLRMIKSLEAFIKKRFEDHIGQCVVTHAAFALNILNECPVGRTCDKCSFPYQVVSYIVKNTTGTHHELLVNGIK